VRTINTLDWFKKLVKDQALSTLPERRVKPRIPLRLSTEYFPPGCARSRLSYTINICETGVLLCLPERMNTGDLLRIVIYYCFDYELMSFEALGKVIWVKKLEDSDVEYRYALEFMEIAPDWDLGEEVKNFLMKTAN
jgi:hypothetical protein